MDFIAKKMAKQKLKSLKDTASDALNTSGNKYKIDWTDFNFPPLIKIYHFNMEEIQEPEREVVSKLYICLLLTCLCLLFNLIVVIYGEFALEFSIKSIIFVVVNFFIWLPLAVFNF